MALAWVVWSWVWAVMTSERGGDAGIVLVLRDGERALVGLHRALEQALERFLVAQLVIGDGELRLEREAHRGDVGGAGLGGGDVALDQAADAAEQVGLPGRRALQRQRGALDPAGAGAADRGGAEHGRKQLGAGLLHQGAACR